MTAPALSADDVRRLARLARLALADEEIESLRRELASILEYAQVLQSIDTNGVEPMAHPLPITNRLDEDVPAPGLDLETILRAAPTFHERWISVPKVLADEGQA